MKLIRSSTLFWGFLLGGFGLGLECALNMLISERLHGTWGYPYDGALFGLGVGISYGVASGDREQLIYGGISGIIAGAFAFLFDSTLGGVLMGLLFGISSCPKVRWGWIIVSRTLGGMVGGILSMQLVLYVMRHYAIPFNEALPEHLQQNVFYAMMWGSVTGASMGLLINNTIELFAIKE